MHRQLRQGSVVWGACRSVPMQTLALPGASQVEELTLTPHVSRELMLVKVSCGSHQRGELVSLASVSVCKGVAGVFWRRCSDVNNEPAAVRCAPC